MHAVVLTAGLAKFKAFVKKALKGKALDLVWQWRINLEAARGATEQEREVERERLMAGSVQKRAGLRRLHHLLAAILRGGTHACYLTWYEPPPHCSALLCQPQPQPPL